MIPMAAKLHLILSGSGQYYGETKLNVLEVLDGYVYMTTSNMNACAEKPCWFLSLCLETMKLERLFWRKFDRDMHLYFMAWPSSLLGKCERFAWEDTPLK